MSPTVFVNLTPHALNIQRVDGTMLNIAPSGSVARVSEQRETLPELAGLSVTRASYGAVEGLPAPTPGTVYIVSALVLAQCAGRADVFAPGPALRDAEGKIVGAVGLSAAPAAPKVTPPVPPTPPSVNEDAALSAAMHDLMQTIKAERAAAPTPNDDDAGYSPLNETSGDGIPAEHYAPVKVVIDFLPPAPPTPPAWVPMIAFDPSNWRISGDGKIATNSRTRETMPAAKFNPLAAAARARQELHDWVKRLGSADIAYIGREAVIVLRPYKRITTMRDGKAIEIEYLFVTPSGDVVSNKALSNIPERIWKLMQKAAYPVDVMVEAAPLPTEADQRLWAQIANDTMAAFGYHDD